MKFFFCASLQSMKTGEGSGVGSGSGSISQRYGSGDPEPDPHQNVTDHTGYPVSWFTTIGILYVQHVRYTHPGKFFISIEYKREVKGMLYFYFTLYGFVGPGLCGHTIKLWRVQSISYIPCSYQHKRFTLNHTYFVLSPQPGPLLKLFK